MNALRSIGDFIEGLIPASHVSYDGSQSGTPQGQYSVRGVPLTDKDINTLRNVLFAEISNRAPSKQSLEAATIVNTALNRIPQYQQQGKQYTLHDVLTSPNQYQGYNSPEYQRVVNNATTTTDGPKLKAIDDTIAQLKTGQFPDSTGGRVFYSHTPQGKIYLKDGTLFKQPRTVTALNQ